MHNEEKLIKDIRERLSEFRFVHSLAVAQSALALAKKYGGDEDSAYITGLSHDILKELSKEEYLAFFEKENITLTEEELAAPKLWHAVAGARYLEKEYGFSDELVSAVRYHTTGRANMTLLEKILFTADFISSDRDYSGVEDMRKRAEASLEYAMEEGLRFTIEELAQNCRPIHPDTVACYNEILLGRLK